MPTRHFQLCSGIMPNLSEEGLKDMGLGHIDSDEVRQMDSVKYIDKLREVGRKTGVMQVNVKEHFKNFVEDI